MLSGKFRSIPRTEGISTTDIIGRLLQSRMSQRLDDDVRVPVSRPHAEQSAFLVTSSKVKAFIGDVTAASSGARVVYICGDWDLFQSSYAQAFQEAKALGDYLIVGVVGDCQGATVMSCMERCLAVMGCKVRLSFICVLCRLVVCDCTVVRR
jgi:ethanolamine-phosphate cytidylyltransferase